MSTLAHPLDGLIKKYGLAAVARAAGVSHQAVRKWQVTGRLPRTEWTGETSYCTKLVALSEDTISREALLAPWPKSEFEPKSPALQGA